MCFFCLFLIKKLEESPVSTYPMVVPFRDAPCRLSHRDHSVTLDDLSEAVVESWVAVLWFSLGTRLHPPSHTSTSWCGAQGIESAHRAGMRGWGCGWGHQAGSAHLRDTVWCITVSVENPWHSPVLTLAFSALSSDHQSQQSGTEEDALAGRIVRAVRNEVRVSAGEIIHTAAHADH